MSKPPFYRLLNHTADLGMCVNGVSLKKLYENAGKALLEQLVILKQSSGGEKLSISLSAADHADLMVKWLSEILYIFNGENLVVEDIRVKSIRENHINSTLTITPFTPDKHDLIREIKAVTYHQIEVKKENNLWITRVIFDL
jgi:SHS2 domain-containing protein